MPSSPTRSKLNPRTKYWWDYLTWAGTRRPPGLRVKSPNGDTWCTKQCCRLVKQPACSRSRNDQLNIINICMNGNSSPPLYLYSNWRLLMGPSSRSFLPSRSFPPTLSCSAFQLIPCAGWLGQTSLQISPFTHEGVKSGSTANPFSY